VGVLVEENKMGDLMNTKKTFFKKAFSVSLIILNFYSFVEAGKPRTPVAGPTVSHAQFQSKLEGPVEFVGDGQGLQKSEELCESVIDVSRLLELRVDKWKRQLKQDAVYVESAATICASEVAVDYYKEDKENRSKFLRRCNAFLANKMLCLCDVIEKMTLGNLKLERVLFEYCVLIKQVECLIGIEEAKHDEKVQRNPELLYDYWFVERLSFFIDYNKKYLKLSSFDKEYLSIALEVLQKIVINLNIEAYSEIERLGARKVCLERTQNLITFINELLYPRSSLSLQAVIDYYFPKLSS
jgi:hypothetical protein